MREPVATTVFPDGDAPEHIETGLWRIPLPLPFALRAVNVYLIDEGPGARTLIDSGLGLHADEAALRAGLAQAGIELADITTLVLTHAHPDHIGLSGLVYGESGARILMLAGEEQRIATVWSDQAGTAFSKISAMLVRHGFPQSYVPAIEAGTTRLLRTLRLPPIDAIETVEEDRDIALGGHSYRTIWTPGHADRHLCLLRDDGLCVVGDHVLPHITPNIGYYPDALPDPLGSYLGALTLAGALPARLALPGHGRPFADLAGRAAAIREHHEARSATVRAVLSSMPLGANGLAVAQAVFGERLRTEDDWRFALLETLAHLEYLRLRGAVTCHESEGGIRYSATDPSETSSSR